MRFIVVHITFQDASSGLTAVVPGASRSAVSESLLVPDARDPRRNGLYSRPVHRLPDRAMEPGRLFVNNDVTVR